MRYIGNKSKLVHWILEVAKKHGLKNDSRVFDCFAGTASVGLHFKSEGYQVITSDIMHYSYVLQKAKIEVSEELPFSFLNIRSNPTFTLNDKIADYFDSVKVVNDGFIYSNYAPGGTCNGDHVRMYFSDIVAKKIDTIRLEIERLKSTQVITNLEYFYLLGSLLYTTSFYSNTAGVFGAFHKRWDPRALKPFKLRLLPVTTSNHLNKSFLGDGTELIKQVETDLVYMDPPYNARQYAPNYHVLETISRYDNPIIKGVSGMRDYSSQKSDFSVKSKVASAMEKSVNNANAPLVLLSYNDEGLLSGEETLKILSQFGEVQVHTKPYPRYKSKSSKTNPDSPKKMVEEKLYVLHKR